MRDAMRLNDFSLGYGSIC